MEYDAYLELSFSLENYDTITLILVGFGGCGVWGGKDAPYFIEFSRISL